MSSDMFGRCSGSVNGHITRPGEGECFACGKRIGPSRHVKWEDRREIDDALLLDPLTLSPIDQQEVDDYRYPRHKRSQR